MSEESVIGWMFTSMDRAIVPPRVDDSVLDNAVVRKLTDRLYEAGRYLMRDDIPSAPADRADGFR